MSISRRVHVANPKVGRRRGFEALVDLKRSIYCFSHLILVFLMIWSMFKTSSSSEYAQTNRSAERKKRIIAFSWYGTSPRYLQGALDNVELHRWVYPSWTIRIYHDNTVPKLVLNLLSRNAELVNMRHSDINPMTWRFLAASDPEVDVFCSRDIDSRLSAREYSAVTEWLASRQNVHMIRDHPGHNYFPLMGGLWCAKHGAISDMRSLVSSYSRAKHFDADQEFLRDAVWPLVNNSVLQHVNFGCLQWPGSRPIPVPRVGEEHVGAVYIDGMLRTEDALTLRKAIISGLECQE